MFFIPLKVMLNVSKLLWPGLTSTSGQITTVHKSRYAVSNSRNSLRRTTNDAAPEPEGTHDFQVHLDALWVWMFFEDRRVAQVQTWSTLGSSESQRISTITPSLLQVIPLILFFSLGAGRSVPPEINCMQFPYTDLGFSLAQRHLFLP